MLLKARNLVVTLLLDLLNLALQLLVSLLIVVRKLIEILDALVVGRHLGVRFVLDSLNLSGQSFGVGLAVDSLEVLCRFFLKLFPTLSSRDGHAQNVVVALLCSSSSSSGTLVGGFAVEGDDLLVGLGGDLNDRVSRGSLLIRPLGIEFFLLGDILASGLYVGVVHSFLRDQLSLGGCDGVVTPGLYCGLLCSKLTAIALILTTLIGGSTVSACVRQVG